MKIDSYADTGSFVAVDLVNAPGLDLEALRVILAVDPPSLTQLRRADEPGSWPWRPACERCSPT